MLNVSNNTHLTISLLYMPLVLPRDPFQRNGSQPYLQMTSRVEPKAGRACGEFFVIFSTN